jgi:ABC-2 type transport system ATP-binding protein
MPIEIQRLQKVINGATALNIEELVVANGSVVAIVGPAESGKKILFDLLTGQSRPTAGTIRLDGHDPYEENEQFSMNTGVLFSEDSLYKRMSPIANLKFQCRLRGLPKSRAAQVLTQVGLADHAKANLDKLPSGLARRLAFGVAMVHSPQVYLLYDPFARCDEASIHLLSGLIGRHAQDGHSILILADDATNLSTICDTIHDLAQGRIVGTRTPSQDPQPSIPFKIPVRMEGKVALVNPTDVLYADADEGRAFLQTAEGRLATQFTLSELEERLSRSGFFRAHRGYLVNLQHVTEVIPFTRNSFSLRLDDEEGTLIPLSKSAASELRDLLGY